MKFRPNQRVKLICDEFMNMHKKGALGTVVRSNENYTFINWDDNIMNGEYLTYRFMVIDNQLLFDFMYEY